MTQPIPQKQRHLEQARRNFTLYRRFMDDGEYLEWAVVFLFYTVVHLVDAHASEDPSSNYPFQFHTARGEYVRTRWFVRQRPRDNMWAWYRFLQERSEDARYGLHRYSSRQVVELYRQTFSKIESFLHSRGCSIRDAFPDLQPPPTIPPPPQPTP